MSPEGNSRAQRFRNAVEPVLRAVVAEGASPGLVVATARGIDAPPLVACAGRLDYEIDSPAAAPSTIYDLASVTKLFTACVAMKLCASGLLDLQTRVRTLLPEFRSGGRSDVTVGYLLSHTSGYLAWAPLYRTAASGTHLKATVRALPLTAPPGTRTVYSDLGIILLGEVLERVGGSPLDELLSVLVTGPLGLTDTCYRPPANVHERVAQRRTTRGGDECCAARCTTRTRQRWEAWLGMLASSRPPSKWLASGPPSFPAQRGSLSPKKSPTPSSLRRGTRATAGCTGLAVLAPIRGPGTDCRHPPSA